MKLLYGTVMIGKRLRKFAEIINGAADYIESFSGLTRSQRKVLKRNEVFLNKHKEKPGFVIANGPSLANQDIVRLKNQITFVVSGFWKHDATLLFQPTYYSLFDKNFFKNSYASNIFYKNLNERIYDSTFFVPLYRGYDAIHKHKFLPLEKTFYIASLGNHALNNDLTKVVQGFGSVSAFALSQAIYMGCNPIYLLGFDHDYLANRGVDRHFYVGGTLPEHELTNIPLGERNPYYDGMKANMALWENYIRLKKFAESKDIKIFNATGGGYLDVFEAIKYEEIKLDD